MLTDKKLFVSTILLFFSAFAFSQTSFAQKTLRMKLWAPIDKNPSIPIEDLGVNPKEVAPYYIQQITPFILTGMIYGWTFEYTPSDKARGVEEFFELKPINTILLSDENIKYSDSATLENRFYCWVEYQRTDEMMKYRSRFDSTMFDKACGSGNSKEIDYIKGIQEAITNAAKTAIHSYAQKLVKNKPRVIEGTILLKDEDPSIKMVSGKYTADLDFFLYVDKITQYSYY